MKKKILRDAILGGFFGLILSKLGEYIYLLSVEGITGEIVEEFLGYLIVYLAFAFWFGVFSAMYHKKNSNSEIKPEQQEEILKKSRIYLIIVEFLTIIVAVISIIGKAPIQFTILIIAISISILVWLVGAHLGYLNLKNRRSNDE